MMQTYQWFFRNVNCQHFIRGDRAASCTSCHRWEIVTFLSAKFKQTVSAFVYAEFAEVRFLVLNRPLGSVRTPVHFTVQRGACWFEVWQSWHPLRPLENMWFSTLQFSKITAPASLGCLVVYFHRFAPLMSPFQLLKCREKKKGCIIFATSCKPGVGPPGTLLHAASTTTTTTCDGVSVNKSLSVRQTNRHKAGNSRHKEHFPTTVKQKIVVSMHVPTLPTENEASGSGAACITLIKRLSRLYS